MNQRIRELAEQAYDLCNKRTYGSLHSPEEFNQKFAEMIVRECADIATINQYQSYTPGHYVLKHFGVE